MPGANEKSVLLLSPTKIVPLLATNIPDGADNTVVFAIVVPLHEPRTVIPIGFTVFAARIKNSDRFKKNCRAHSSPYYFTRNVPEIQLPKFP